MIFTISWIFICSIIIVFLKNKTLKIHFDIYSGLYLFVSLEKIQFSFLDYISQKILREGSLEANKTFQCHYKFYGEILAKLLELNYQFGISTKKTLANLRHLMVIDIRFQKKIKMMFLSSVAQFVILSLCTWGFIFCSAYILNVNVSWSVKGIILGLHLSGLGLFYFLSLKTLNCLFLNADLMIKSLSIIHLLHNYSLPQKRVLEIAQTYEMLSSKFPENLKPIRENLQNLLTIYTHQGKSIQEELKILLTEYYHWQEKQFDFGEKLLISYKFIIILGFYLSSYFLFVYFLTIEMIKQG